MDYGAYEGDPVKAPANGRVVLVGKEKDGFEIHGNCVGLDHGQGVTSILMHLNSSFVKYVCPSVPLLYMYGGCLLEDSRCTFISHILNRVISHSSRDL